MINAAQMKDEREVETARYHLASYARRRQQTAGVFTLNKGVRRVVNRFYLSKNFHSFFKRRMILVVRRSFLIQAADVNSLQESSSPVEGLMR